MDSDLQIETPRPRFDHKVLSFPQKGFMIEPFFSTPTCKVMAILMYCHNRLLFRENFILLQFFEYYCIFGAT